MADEPKKIVVQGSRIDASILPPGFTLPYRLYVIQQSSDLKNLADGANNAGDLAYQATLKNEEQDTTLADHENRISGLRSEVDDHESRITGNTSAISSLSSRVANAEGSISTLQTDVSALQTNASSLTLRVTAVEGSVSALQGDYVSKSVVASQTLASPLNVTTSYSVGGVKVVGSRDTGWTASTGSALKAAFNASQAYTIGATYAQAEITALRDGVIQARQRIKALEDAMRAHGLIN